MRKLIWLCWNINKKNLLFSNTTHLYFCYCVFSLPCEGIPKIINFIFVPPIKEQISHAANRTLILIVVPYHHKLDHFLVLQGNLSKIGSSTANPFSAGAFLKVEERLLGASNMVECLSWIFYLLMLSVLFALLLDVNINDTKIVIVFL